MLLPPPFGRRRRARQRLRYEQSVLRALLASVDVPVIAWSMDGRLTHSSRGASKLIGVACPPDTSLEALIEELRPRTHSGVPMPVEDLPPVRALQGEVLRDVDVLVQLGGRNVLFSTSARPIEDTKGRRQGAAVVLEDVTEDRRREAVLRARLSTDDGVVASD